MMSMQNSFIICFLYHPSPAFSAIIFKTISLKHVSKFLFSSARLLKKKVAIRANTKVANPFFYLLPNYTRMMTICPALPSKLPTPCLNNRFSTVPCFGCSVLDSNTVIRIRYVPILGYTVLDTTTLLEISSYFFIAFTLVN